MESGGSHKAFRIFQIPDFLEIGLDHVTQAAREKLFGRITVLTLRKPTQNQGCNRPNRAEQSLWLQPTMNREHSKVHRDW